uniref:DYW domain-containing protein n=1 Tax=Nelumbo nucifera TaxID=4432 RepID=A0A822XUV5_NELNU|nr:TPA_asm: hypothetical protein HUJ06_026868 [Nelumbo nucifera]
MWRDIIESSELKTHLFQSYSGYSLSPPSEPPGKISSHANLADNSRVQLLHSQAIKAGSLGCLQVCNHILNLYVKGLNLGSARKLFDEIPNRDVRTWTILIAGFARLGPAGAGLVLFTEMQTEGIRPNHFSLSSVLKCCSSLNNLRCGKGVHGWILRHGVVLDVVLDNSMIDIYVKCAKVDYAGRIFESVTTRDTVSWNIMIDGYLQIGNTEKAMELFRRLPLKYVSSWNTIIVGQMRNGYGRKALELLCQMVEIGPDFNKVTYSTALALAASLAMLEVGRQIHGKLLRVVLDYDEFIMSSLIDMYCKCGKLDKAALVFEKMPHDLANMQNSKISSDRIMANVISWSSMISGCIQNGSYEEAIKLFQMMIHEGLDVDQFTLTSIASACANAGILYQGQQIHAYIEKTGHKLDVFLGSAIIDMYAKCGNLDDAHSIFFQTNGHNVVLWTSMISACSLHGQGREAVHLFEQMLKEGISPNEVSFVGVLSGCSHAGLVEEANAYFRSMKEDYGIVPRVEHFTCMVDLLGRAGLLDEAMEFIYSNNISHMTAVWRALLSACRIHKNVQIGNWASEQLSKLEPFDAGLYVLSSNICSATHRWEEAAEIRSLMEERRVKKKLGQSWIQIKNQIHTFTAGDRSHPQAAEIYCYLDKLIGRLKEIGYSTDTKPVMHDVEEEQKEVLLAFHSEKLAIAYGIMNTSCRATIRVMKNLRVCTDCHTFIKYTSLAMDKELVVRDAHRYHHFKHGQCSCGDYW